MFSIRFNRNLLIMALIGVALYLSVVAWYGIRGETNPDTLSSVPPVTKEMAESTALDWFRNETGTTAEIEGTVYITDKQVQGYLEKNDLTKEYEKTLEAVVPLDYWRVALKADNESRIYVRVGLDEAKVYGFQTPKPRSDNAVSIKINDADEAVSMFGYSRADFEIGPPPSGKGYSIDTAPMFRFTSKSQHIGEAKLVIDISSNDKGLTEILPSLEPPADFISWMNKQDTGAGLYSILYIAGALIFGIVGLILIILKRKQSRFSRGILFSLVFLSAIGIYTYNSLPAQLASVEPSQLGIMSSSNFLFITSMIIYVLLAVSLYFNAVSGDVLWRERGWNPWPRWKDANFGNHVYASMGRGYLLCIFVMGVQQVLFLFAYNVFDTFSVNDPSQSMENLYWPWLFPTLAWYAGIGEEIVFRLFGISLFRKMLPEGRSRVSQNIIRFLSVLLPALIWAAGHAAYAFYPNYTRLFEVAALGLIFGFVFLRYGLYTAIFTHVSMDIILMSLSYMVDEKTIGATLLGIFYMATPFLVAAIILFLHRTFRKTPVDPPAQPLPNPNLYPYPNPGPVQNP
ncbi:CPBP family intramembrane glutamic endopeptidase [Gorillibacterium timonense]|uniref:CPBP family intramembrane glutamic endopeptidase n=1 Tax=Gorillibacterium timonense TaxID=1689269 RepID=UPI00071CB83D|nr:CPBP family intramembrane glutamic endopeptidase [Gorillibacterium timonense]